MLTTTIDALLGNGLNHSLLVGKCDGIKEDVFITSIIIQDLRHGKDQTQNDCNASQVGRVNVHRYINSEVMVLRP